MFKGSNVALVTPFKDNKLDEETYIKLINFHLEIDEIFLCFDKYNLANLL